MRVACVRGRVSGVQDELRPGRWRARAVDASRASGSSRNSREKLEPLTADGMFEMDRPTCSVAIQTACSRMRCFTAGVMSTSNVIDGS